jgi:ribonuclease R
MRKKHLKKPTLIKITGTIRMHSRGFGFVTPEQKTAWTVDIFIPKPYTEGAVDGDYVEATAGPSTRSDKGPEGRVIKILRRGRSHLAGVISYVGGKKQIFAYAPLLGENQTIRILPSQDHPLQIGDRITIRVLDWGGRQREPTGEMSAYIGHISDPACDMAAAIEEFELPQTFPEKTLQEAKTFGQRVAPEEFQDRVDLRDLVCFTIDPDTAKDFDDALSLSRDQSGNFHLGIHIADVSHYVKPNSSLDLAAKERCNSVYFPGMVIPMLPLALSSHLCSLKPAVNRLAVSVLVILDPEGIVKDYTICRSVIRSRKRFTYREAKEVLDGDKKSQFKDDLTLMVELCLLLKKKRYTRGSIEFSLPDLSLKLASDGNVEKIEFVSYDITHQLVEEYMLLANEIVATHLSKQDKPLTYRIHEEPSSENLRDFASTATALGFNISSQPTTEELQQLFDTVRSTSLGEFLATAFIKSMKLANYSTQNVGHYGLSLEHYTHFTSPIRRYIDLVVHRILLNEKWEEKDLEAVALRCSEHERLSAKAEASVIQLKKLRYLNAEALAGNDAYEAVVVSIKSFGLVFELKTLLYEGFLPSSHTGFAVGTQIRIKLIHVDLITRQATWHLLSKKSLPQREDRLASRAPKKRRGYRPKSSRGFPRP